MATAVITRNSREGEAPPAPPVHEDGSLYPYAMYFNGYKTIAYADDTDALIDALSPGYQELEGEQAKLIARIKLATNAQVRCQALINADLEPSEWEALSEEEKSVLMAPRHTQPSVEFWNSTVMLIVVETGYAPTTAIERPLSGFGDVQNPQNMLWLRPLDEWDLLESLANVGFISISQATDML